jgi:hypothetical protein
MSPSTSTNDRGVLPAEESSVPAPVRAVAFWAAVVLPFCTLALLAGGLETALDYAGLVGLLTANVVALVVGHGYGQ